MELVYFLGRFHVLALHLPIALILLAVLIDWLARSDERRALEPAARVLWGLAAVAAVGTALLGYLHFAEGGFDGPSASAHRAYGTGVAAGAVVIWGLRSRAPDTYRRMRFAAMGLLVVLLVLAGHHGGNLTHGSTYLVEYAPEPVRLFAGREAARADPVRSAPSPDPPFDGRAVEILEAAGYLVRRVSQSDARLVVSVYSAGTALGAEQLAALAAAADRIVELNLQRSAIDDADLGALPVFPALTHLRLDNNAVTDAGVAALARQARLSHLNLYGNAGIGDASVVVLAAMGSLRKVFLSATGVSGDGIAELLRLRPDVGVEPAVP